MPLVAFDSNVIDLWAASLAPDPTVGEALETLAWPPDRLSPSEHAVYWLAALAPSWPACLYTFSDLLYKEVADMPPQKRQKAQLLLHIAADIREQHPEEYREVEALDPTPDEVAAIGLGADDARHVADAIGLRAEYFLTCDKGILKREFAIRNEWYMRVLLPEDFLLNSVRRGAPWPSSIEWPWMHAELRDAALRLGMIDNE